MSELTEKEAEQVVGGTDIPTFEDPIQYLDPVYYEYTPTLYTYYEPSGITLYDDIDLKYISPDIKYNPSGIQFYPLNTN